MRVALLVLVILLVLVLPAAAQDAPNDPGYVEQWALPKVGAPCAWNLTTGSTDVTVAVIDSGVDLDHPDLLGRLRTDGYDFVDNDADPRDENGHGTNVAGIIVATLNNRQGGTGLAPGVRILPVRVMNARGRGSDAAIARGVRYAADKGAQIINISLGATLTIAADSASSEVGAAIRYAQARGALVIAAAGNDFLPLPNAIVAASEDVLIVAATDPQDRRAPFSNYGDWVGISAPGVHMYSTLPTYPVFLTSDSLPPDERLRPGYDFMSGTSQATPLVSATAALLLTLRPDWGPTEIVAALRAHTATLAPDAAADGQLGSGRLDACAVLAAVAIPATPVPAENDPAVAAVPATVLATLPSTPPPRAVRPTPVPVRAPPQQITAAAPWWLLSCALLIIASVLALFGRERFLPPRLPAGAAPELRMRRGPGVIRGRLPGLIGRAPECTVVMSNDPAISRVHAQCWYQEGQLMLADRNSTHGLWVNRRRVRGTVVLRHGDHVRFGETVCVVLFS